MGGTVPDCALAITSVAPAANRANIKEINKRSIREVILYILLGSIFKAGTGASMKTWQEIHSSDR